MLQLRIKRLILVSIMVLIGPAELADHPECLTVNIECPVEYNSDKNTVSSTNCSMKILRRSAFDQSGKCVEALVLKDNHIEEIEPRTFESLSKLKQLDLSNNSIAKLSPETFQGAFTLTALNLSFNNIRAIEKDSFFNLTQLTHLDLSHNEIGDIEKGGFAGLKKLLSLDLSYNKILTMRDIFKPLIRMSMLNLEGNKLKTLKGSDIGFNFFNRTINVAHNEIKDLHFKHGTLLGWLTLNLQSNQIAGIRSDFFEKFRMLVDSMDLSHNRIAFVEDILLTAFIKKMNLSHNELRTLHFDTFSSIEVLDCSHNKISEVTCSGDMFASLLTPENKELDLSFNHIQDLPYKELQTNNVRTLKVANNSISCYKQRKYFGYFSALGSHLEGSSNCSFTNIPHEKPSQYFDKTLSNTFFESLPTPTNRSSTWKMIGYILFGAKVICFSVWMCLKYCQSEESQENDVQVPSEPIADEVPPVIVESITLEKPATPPPSYEDVIKKEREEEFCEPPTHEWAIRNCYGGGVRFEGGDRGVEGDCQRYRELT